ncbi:MAG: hypothetical protein QOJ29_2836 [Thermoleophilaceae bacterium]|nr:hypothetical protein [Thermoleophilaceae bacterium]
MSGRCPVWSRSSAARGTKTLGFGSTVLFAKKAGLREPIRTAQPMRNLPARSRSVRVNVKAVPSWAVPLTTSVSPFPERK